MHDHGVGARRLDLNRGVKEGVGAQGRKNEGFI